MGGGEGRDRQRPLSAVACSLLASASWALYVNLSPGWQGPETGAFHGTSQGCRRGELSQDLEPGAEPRHSDVAFEHFLPRLSYC